MLYGIIGVGSAFLVILPFLLFNFLIAKIEKPSVRRLLFLIVNIIQVIFIAILGYLLYFVEEETLYGLAIVVSIFLFFELFIWIIIRKKSSGESELIDEDIENTQNLNLENEEVEHISNIEVDEENIDDNYDEEEIIILNESVNEEEEEEEIILLEDEETKEVEDELNKVDTKQEITDTLEEIFRKNK